MPSSSLDTQGSQPPAQQPERARGNDPWIGRVLVERYEIISLIAAGGMGRVYRAIQRPLGRTVAVKVLHVGGDPRSLDDFASRFSREAEVLGGLQHPHTVRIFEYGVDGDNVFFAMEYVDGPTLADIMAEGSLDPLRAIHIVRQICGALEEAHSRGVIHRDLKPSNVLLTGDDDFVKVVDFGVVKIADDNLEITSPDVVVGTPTYMAPEQIDGISVDARSDLYSLGVVLYLLFTGRPPFDVGDGGRYMIRAHLVRAPVSFQERGVTLPPVVEWTVMRCLEKEPESRFGSALELARALNACEMALRNASMRELTLRLEKGQTLLPAQLQVMDSGFDGVRPVDFPSVANPRALTAALMLSVVAVASVLLMATLGVQRSSPALGVSTRPVSMAALPEIGAPSDGDLRPERSEMAASQDPAPSSPKAIQESPKSVDGDRSRDDLRDPFGDLR